MTISGVSSNAYMNYSSYRTTGAYSSSQSATGNTNQTQQINGRPDGPPPPPRGGGGKGGGMKGPDLDTDSDGLWSTEELEEFAATASSEFGVTIDTENILSTYDTDGDGSINSDERVALGENKAFNLPSPKDMMHQMRGFSPPPNIQSVGSNQAEQISSEEESNASIIQQLIEAYNQQNIDLYDELLAPTVTYNV